MSTEYESMDARYSADQNYVETNKFYLFVHQQGQRF